MKLTLKQYILENTVDPQHTQFADEVKRLLGVTAVSPADRDVIHNGMKTGLSPKEVASQLGDALQTAGGPGLSGG